MSKICGNCGAPIKPDTVKCFCCGRSLADVAIDESMRYGGGKKIPSSSPKAPNNAPNTNAPTLPSSTPVVAPSRPMVKTSVGSLFSYSNWKSTWAEKRRCVNNLGIILTDTSALANASEFMRSLSAYVDYKSQNGIEYFLLDLKNQNVCRVAPVDIDNVINLLTEIYEVAVPDYLMIIGDSTVIPRADWINESGDDDETVPSDLPYITLDTESPWEGVYYDLDGVTQVGRIPTKASSNFTEAIKYFDNTRQFRAYNIAKPFAYSAEEWERTSNVVYSHLNLTPILSPRYTSNQRLVSSNNLTMLNKLSSEYNLLCFNLHGSDATHDWYGQKGDFYPEAFNQSLLPSNAGYVLMTEACYGARPLSSGSIVCNAIANNCIAYVGSTMIAYGAVTGGMSCADIIANSFSKGVMKGWTVGKAFLYAISELTGKAYLNEAEIKTIAEFALYGDPSAVLVSAGMSNESARRPGASKRSSSRRDRSLAITLIPCNAIARKNSRSGSVTLQSFSPEAQNKLLEEANRIANSTRGVVLESFSAMESIEPSVYKVMGKEEYRAVYSRKVEGIKSILNMHIDKDGKVKAVYGSK